MPSNRLAELRARTALAGARLDPELVLQPLESVTNEVWAAGDAVIRVNRRLHSRLRREVELARRLPSEVLYPGVIAVGAGSAGDWAVLRRVAGAPLVRCWPGMTIDERRLAVGQLATALAALHRSEVRPDLATITDPPQLLQPGAQPTAPTERALQQAKHLHQVDAGAMAELYAYVRSRQHVLQPFDVKTLIHGDLHFQNVLWDGSRLTALLDLEFARAAPPDLDLDVFLRFCCYPFLFVPEGREGEARPEDYAEVPFWLREAYPALFSAPEMLDRLRIYSIAFDVRDLLANPPSASARSLTVHHPYRRLLATLTESSHLDLLARS